MLIWKSWIVKHESWTNLQHNQQAIFTVLEILKFTVLKQNKTPLSCVDNSRENFLHSLYRISYSAPKVTSLRIIWKTFFRQIIANSGAQNSSLIVKKDLSKQEMSSEKTTWWLKHICSHFIGQKPIIFYQKKQEFFP